MGRCVVTRRARVALASTAAALGLAAAGDALLGWRLWRQRRESEQRVDWQRRRRYDGICDRVVLVSAIRDAIDGRATRESLEWALAVVEGDITAAVWDADDALRQAEGGGRR